MVTKTVCTIIPYSEQQFNITAQKYAIDGVTEFSVAEALKIRDTFFPGLRVEYLFATADEMKEERKR